jgi:nitrogen-specific signal transduction histidine kinase
MKAKLFAPFATTKKENGSGLGLWVSRAIVGKNTKETFASLALNQRYLDTTVSIFLPLKATARIGSDEAAAPH